MEQTKELKEGELCCGFSWGGGGVVRSTGAQEGTRYCMKKKEKEKGSGELNPLIYITPSSCQETKQ
jgi:hypothetical protein